MADHLSPEGRSRNMTAIRSKNTKPELALRAALRQAGAKRARAAFCATSRQSFKARLSTPARTQASALCRHG